MSQEALRAILGVDIQRSSLHDTSDFFDSQGGNEDEISLDTEDEISPQTSSIGRDGRITNRRQCKNRCTGIHVHQPNRKQEDAREAIESRLGRQELLGLFVNDLIRQDLSPEEILFNNSQVLTQITPGSADQEEQHFVVVPESVEVNLGEDVVLRCVVRNQQGKVQWTKDGFALGEFTSERFEREVPGYPRYSYLGDPAKGEHHLVINGTTLEDDGEYQCQVGPTGTTSALWAAAITLPVWNPLTNVDYESISLASGSSSIIVKGDREETVEGFRGRPSSSNASSRTVGQPLLSAWYRNGVLFDQELHMERLETSPNGRSWSVVSHLFMTPEAEDDGQQFSCRAMHPSLTNSPTPLVASIALSVLLGYFPGGILRAGDTSSTLACQSPGGNPTPELTWYKNGQLLKPQNFTSETNEGKHEDGKLSLVIKVRPEDDKAVYECQAVNEMAEEPVSANVTFTVHYSPKRVTVKGPSVVAAGQTFTLTCITSSANPSASIHWLVDGVEVATVSSLVSEGEGGGWVTSSDLNYSLERSVSLAEISVECRAYNSVRDAVVKETRVISVIKPPGVPACSGGGGGRGGRGASWWSSVAAQEAIHIRASRGIYKGHEKLLTEVTVDGRVTIARAVTEVTPSDNGAKISCQVSNPATDAPLVATTPIELFFPPWEVKAGVSPTNVSAGQVAKLICESSSSLPASTITWRSGSVTNHGATSMHRSGLYGGQVTRSELEVRALIEDNQKTHIHM
ncbi:nephrin-like [Macrobrachium nipponense]|uniref:nephrin-like n=1 Tax=Macrobrachium nipponense TaxID=159736 RepID=UPI0030C7ACBA